MIEHSDEIIKYFTEKDATLIQSKIIEGYYHAKRNVNTIQFKRYSDYDVCTIHTRAWNNILVDNNEWVYLPDLIRNILKSNI